MRGGGLRGLSAFFALYRTDSEIARLNRDGHIEFPSVDLLTVLSQCQVLSSLRPRRLWT